MFSIKSISYYLLVLVMVMFFVIMAQITIPYFSFQIDIDFLLTKQAVIHIDWWRWAFYTHISCSIWLLILGVLQFSKYLQKHYLKTHRLLGKAYVLILCVLAAPSGLVMAFYANGGIWAKVSFILLSSGWFYFTYRAYLFAKHGNIKRHTSFMYRSYVLTLSAIILRLLVMILPHFFILPAAKMYTLVSWLSWVPSLLIMEIYYYYRNTSKSNISF